MISMRHKLRQHPNSIMLFSYFLWTFLSSFLINYPFISTIFIPMVVIGFNGWIRLDFNELIKQVKQIKWLCFIVLLIVTFIIITFLSALNGPQASNNTSDLIKMVTEEWSLPIYIVIFAPIMEELVFRSSLYRICERVAGSLLKNKDMIAIICYLIVGLSFAIIHVDNLMGIYVIFSCILQGITNKFGLSYSIGVHISMNLISFLILIF